MQNELLGSAFSDAFGNTDERIAIRRLRSVQAGNEDAMYTKAGIHKYLLINLPTMGSLEVA